VDFLFFAFQEFLRVAYTFSTAYCTPGLFCFPGASWRDRIQVFHLSLVVPRTLIEFLYPPFSFLKVSGFAWTALILGPLRQTFSLFSPSKIGEAWSNTSSSSRYNFLKDLELYEEVFPPFFLLVKNRKFSTLLSPVWVSKLSVISPQKEV